ncbi:MAG: TraR/DksA family transcriptional regulator [Calditrichaeota bacterium]|nr:TraR/DksA family transcriptional regulator [Calditrichota bacterium]
MDKKQLEKIRELLLDRQRELLSDAGASVEDIDQLQSAPAADWVDRVTVDSAVSSMIARESGLAKELEDIKDALIKIEKGTYGICERCGQEINQERLEAIPTARLCRECQQQEEKNMRRGEDFRGAGNIPKEVFEWYE